MDGHPRSLPLIGAGSGTESRLQAGSPSRAASQGLQGHTGEGVLRWSSTHADALLVNACSATFLARSSGSARGGSTSPDCLHEAGRATVAAAHKIRAIPTHDRVDC